MAVYYPHYRRVVADDADPQAWMLVAHGLLGSGDNWATFARELVARRPEWGVALVDLRMHGKSQGAPPPHTIGAAARDLAALAERLAEEGRPVRAVAGHSLGGKVALALRADERVSLVQTWVLDASPGICAGCAMDPENPVVRLLAALDELPESHSRRQEFVEGIVGRGFPEPVARWLAKSLARVGRGYRFELDLDAMRALLADYYAQDLWVDAGEIGADESVHFVVAGASEVVDREARARLGWLEKESAGRLRVHLLGGASHWLHMDARDELVAIVAAELPRV